MNRYNLSALMVLAFASGAYADCGDESWVVPPKEVPENIAVKTRQVMTLFPPKDAPATLPTYILEGDNFKPSKRIPAEELVPVSRSPVCHDEKHPLRGGRFPVLNVKGQYAEAIVNARTGFTVWVSTPEVKGYLVNLDSISKATALNAEFFPSEREIKIHPFPDDNSMHTIYPKGALLKSYQQQGDWIHIEATRWDEKKKDWEKKSVGWTRLRSPEGRLLFWPWYSDDC